MKKLSGISCLLVYLLLGSGIQSLFAQPAMKDDLVEYLMKKKAPVFDSILAHRKELNVQIMYTEIQRGKKGKIKFTDHLFNVDDRQYYYPASTVKLPIAILALQKLHELNIPGLDKNTTMITGREGERQTEVCNDPSAPDGRPTIAHYIKKILLVSDNDAFNRLYEFLGQEYINNTLHKMGYTGVQIIHRLDISLPEEDNRHTNPVEFIDTSGKLIYYKPAERSQLVYAERDTKLGNGFLRNGQLIHEPFDFSKKNRFPLTALHGIVKSVIFPEAVPAAMRFDLTPDDYLFLQRYMSMMPQESVSPVYDTVSYWDTYVKFLYYGAEKNTAEPALRIFNKVGDAYGFLIEGAYIVDYEKQKEFLLSAIIYCNSDGIFNDDQYDYDTLGLPFMKQLGRMILEYERTKVRGAKALFSPQKFHYTD